MSEINKFSIKNWAESDRPREKLLNKGINSLSDAELIAILIGSGNRNESAVELSKRILKDRINNLNELAQLTVNELTEYKGIGEAKAISIVAALELGKRRRLSEIIKREQISSSKDAFDYFSKYLSDLQYEEFWILLLNTASKIISSHKIGQGGMHKLYVDIKLIVKLALEKNANSIILSHNHPSGSLTPSISDKLLTTKIIKAAKLFDIAILDHIVIYANTYFSFADNELLH